MTREEIIKSALKFLVLKQTEQGSQGFSDSDENEISWDKVIEWLDKQPCEDCISRKAVKGQMIKYGFKAPDMTVTEFVEDCLPSVTPTRPTGKWIDIGDEGLVFKCSLCGNKNTIESKYCSNCGAKMNGVETEVEDDQQGMD